MAEVVRLGPRRKGTAPDDSTVEAREKYLQLARDRFKEVREAESTLRTNMLEDKTFRASDQWPETIKAQRAAEGRPCLTVNRLPQFIRQVTNQQRENRPAVTVSAVDSIADPKTAQVFQGIIRHIENNSQAQVAYNTAADDQATIGRGYVRILSEYASAYDMEQSLVIRRVRNPFTIYMDPACQELDYSDARYAFVVSDLTATQYKDAFGDRPPAGGEFSSIGDEKPHWLLGDAYRVAEYWTVEQVEDTLLQLETGDTILASEVPAEGRIPGGVMAGGRPLRIITQRDLQRNEVHVGIINGIEVLDGNEQKTGGKPWPGIPGKAAAQWIPIIPFIGEEIDINGKVDLRGVVRDAKDPQRRYNYSVTATTEIAALAPKSPWVMAEGQDEGFEEVWKHANVTNYSALKYKPIDINGQLAPPPQRNAQEPPIQAMVLLTSQADNDLMNVTGRYQASLGAQGPEQSGKAIMARQRQGDIGSYNFQDNANLAVATIGRYLVDLIPKVYSKPRIMRILGPDDKPKTVMLHAGGIPPEQKPDGVDGIYDVGVGRYDVSVSAGPSYASKRAEFREIVMQLGQAFPPAAPILLPMIARNMDIPYADELARKLQTLLPPEARDPEEGQPPPPPPEMVAQMQQMEQMLQQMGQELEKAQRALESKQVENASEVEQERIAAASRVKVAEIERDAVLRKTAAQNEVDLALGRMKALTADTSARLAAMKSSSPPASGKGNTRE